MICGCSLSTLKETIYVAITFSTYTLVGISRSYLSILFYQLDHTDSVKLTDDEKSWTASFTMLLSPLGCFIVGIIMDKYGRKLSVQTVFIPFIISWFIMAFATSYKMFYAAALIQSVGGGMSFGTSVYVSEITTARHRGAALGIIEITYSVGLLVCFFSLNFLQWNIAALVIASLCVVTLMLSFSLPESPTWLYLKGRKEEAISVLTTMRCENRADIDFEIQDMEKHCSNETKLTIFQTVRNCLDAWKSFLIAVVLFILQQNTGYSIVTSYLIMVVDSLHIPYKSTDMAILYAIVSAIASFITPVAMHMYNRKTILSISALGMALSTMIIAVYQLTLGSHADKPYAWIIPIAICLYIITSSIGVLSIGYTVSGEMFPSEVRGVMNGAYGMFAHLYWSALFKIVPWYLATVGGTGLMWTFTGFSLLMTLYGIFILPETKGKTLNEVQEQYFKKKSKSMSTQQSTSIEKDEQMKVSSKRRRNL